MPTTDKRKDHILIETKGLSRSLIHDLREQIIMGEFAPGERLNENQIALKLGISRSPLREALRILENEHLIVSIPRKGSSVTDISYNDLNEIYQMREMIECFAIDVFKEKKITDLPQAALVAEKTRHITAPSEDDSPKDKLAYVERIADYHMILVESAGNERIYKSYIAIHSNINRYVFLNAFLQGVVEHRVEEHFQILKSLKQGHYREAKTIIRDHIRYAAEQLRIKMEKNELNQSIGKK